jgi:hypothetical protein
MVIYKTIKGNVTTITPTNKENTDANIKLGELKLRFRILITDERAN